MLDEIHLPPSSAGVLFRKPIVVTNNGLTGVVDMKRVYLNSLQLYLVVDNEEKNQDST